MDSAAQNGQRPPAAAEVFAPVSDLIGQAQHAVEQHKFDVAVQAIDSIETALPQLRAYAAKAA